MADEVRELQKQAQRKKDKAQEILERAEKRGKGSISDSEVAEFEGLLAEADTLRKLADQKKRLREREENAIAQREGRKAVGAEEEIRSTETLRTYGGGSEDPNYRRAFSTWMRQGKDNLEPEQRAILQTRVQSLDMEQRALAVGTDSAGGYAVPESFHERVVEAMKAYDGVREAGATVLRTSDGRDMPIPINDDTGEKGSIVDENAEVSDQDPTFSSKTLGSYMYASGLVRVSFQLMQDAGFPMDEFLAGALGRRLGRVLNEHFTDGDGSSEPEGVLTAIDDAGTHTHTADAPDGISYDDIIGLVHTVDPSYRGRNAAFMVNDSTVHAIRGLTDSDDRPLWQPSIQAGQPDRLLGYRVIVNPEMPGIIADGYSVVFGDFSRYFIRDVEGGTLLRLTERYAERLQIGFIYYGRHDGLLTDTKALAALQHPDS